MRFVGFWIFLTCLFGLVACGGGGGPDTSVKVPSLAIMLVDSAESVVSDRSLSATDARYLKVVARTKSGAAAAFTPVTITLSVDSAVLLPIDGQKLTDANGVALIKISPADPSVGFVLRGTATATVETVTLTAGLDLQYSGGGTVITGAPTMDMSLVASPTGPVIANKALSQTESRYLKVVLKTKAGNAAAYSRVTVTLDSSQAVLVPSSGVGFTDDAGVMLMQISPASVSAAGGVLATATASVESVALSKALDLSISSGTVALSDFQVSPATVQQGQSLNVSVAVQVNGATAPSNSVPVTFTSICGTATPSPALVDSTGRASAVLLTTSTGTCPVTAGTTGNVSVAGSFSVTTRPPTGVTFVSATPTLIYQSGTAAEPKQSIVVFKVIDSNNGPLSGKSVTGSLTNTSSDSASICSGTPATAISGTDGTVSFCVSSGTVPGSVQVSATLDGSSPPISTVSNTLTVQTSLPTQRFFGLSSSQPNFLAGGYFTAKTNGYSTTITAYAADRLGNPVPPGTTVNFRASGGLVSPASCVIADTTGRCSVTLYGQDYRPLGSASTSGTSPTGAGGDPRPGRVTVLAFADGEEHFFDTDNNNRYDDGELFEDLGAVYIDRDNNKFFEAAYANLQTGSSESDTVLWVPGGTLASCSATDIAANPGLSKEGSCNGKWDGFTQVRRSLVVVFSGDAIGQPASYNVTIPGIDPATSKRTRTVSSSSSAVTVQLADLDGNPLPADATIAVEVILANDTSTCSAILADTTIGNASEPTQHTAALTTCGTGDRIKFVVTAPNGRVSSYTVAVP